MFPHRNIHKYTCTSPDGKTLNQIDHILRDRRRHSSILDVLSFRGADCDTDHYLVVCKSNERFAVSKQTARWFDWERFNLRKLNDLEVRKDYHIETKIRCAVFENLSDDEDINRNWENIEENINTPTTESLGLHELKQYKPWFDEECSGFFYIKEERLKCSGYRTQAKAM